MSNPMFSYSYYFTIWDFKGVLLAVRQDGETASKARGLGRLTEQHRGGGVALAN